MISTIETTSRYIYHYTNEMSLLEFIIPTKKLRFGKLQNTNDPMEYYPYKPCIEFFENDKGYDELVEMIDCERNKYKLVAFCKDQSAFVHERGYSKPRMWAQYGNLHRGACIVLDKKKFEASIRNRFTISSFWKEISYNEIEPQELQFTYDKNIEAETEIASFVRSNIDQLLFTKSKDWMSENEVRYAIYSENEYEFISIEDSIAGIVFGHCCPELIMEKVIEEFPDIETTRLTWKNGYPSYCGINSGYSGFLQNQIHYNLVFFFKERNQTFSDNERGIKLAIDEYFEGERRVLLQMIHTCCYGQNSTIYDLLDALEKIKDVRKETQDIEQ